MSIVIERPTGLTDMPSKSPLRRITTLSWTIVAIGMILLGGFFLYVSSADTVGSYPVVKAFSNNVGGVLLATGLISLLWELVSRRAFLSEVFSIARLSEDVKRSGLHRLTMDFQHEVEWPELLESARRIDVFVSYARTWRNQNLSRLRAFAERPGSQMNLILPDPDNEEVIRELARRYSTNPEAIRDRVNEAISAFMLMFDRKKGAKGQLSIWVTTATPVFTFYRIDKKYILSTYRHRSDRGDILTLVCDRKGDLTDFIDREYEYLTDDSAAGVRRVFPPPKSLPAPESSDPARDRAPDQTQAHSST
jgi:hypothetical protein